MLDANTLSAVFGFIATVTVLASMQLKNIRTVLIVQVICNIAGALSFLVLGQVSACSLYFVAVAESALFLAYNLYKKDAPKYWAWVFAAAFVACSVVTFKAPTDTISMLAAITCALALAQKNASVYRIIMLVNGCLWITFDICTGAWGMILAHIITALSALVGIARLDLKLFSKKSKEEANGEAK
ncbi:MAG: YgjV family protein [Clostridia bacterium]|nr:YgjV family protein [Clostridia bacterium]